MSSFRLDPSHRHCPHGALANGWDPDLTTESVARPTLSIIAPAKNESANLEPLVREAAEAFRPLVNLDSAHPLAAFEIIIVDDGSTDDSIAVLQQLMTVYPELRPIHLDRNVGQSSALAEGFRAARGDWVGTLDADLQNPPAELAKLWLALPGHDAVLGWRIKREDVWSKRVTSKWANRVRNWILGQSIRDTGCAIRIFSRKTALRLPLFHGVHRFFGPLLIRDGCKIHQVPVEHRPRSHGVSHYSFRNRSFKVINDLLGVAWLMRRPVIYQQATPITITRNVTITTNTMSPEKALSS